MKYFSTILTILGMYLFVYACAEKPCTDDGCPDFNKEGDDNDLGELSAGKDYTNGMWPAKNLVGMTPYGDEYIAFLFKT